MLSRRTGRGEGRAALLLACLLACLAALGCEHPWGDIDRLGSAAADAVDVADAGDAGGSGGSTLDSGPPLEGEGGVTRPPSLPLNLAVCVGISLKPGPTGDTLADGVTQCTAWITSKNLGDALGIATNVNSEYAYAIYLAFDGDEAIDPSTVASVTLRLFVPNNSSIPNGPPAGELYQASSFGLDSVAIPEASMFLASTGGADGTGKIARGKPVTWKVTPFNPSTLDLRKPVYLAIKPENTQPAFYASQAAQDPQERPQLLLTYK